MFWNLHPEIAMEKVLNHPKVAKCLDSECWVFNVRFRTGIKMTTLKSALDEELPSEGIISVIPGKFAIVVDHEGHFTVCTD
jgi:hypothetical protein